MTRGSYGFVILERGRVVGTNPPVAGTKCSCFRTNCAAIMSFYMHNDLFVIVLYDLFPNVPGKMFLNFLTRPENGIAAPGNIVDCFLCVIMAMIRVQ